jgi:Family of unknown function (DUF5706)
VSNDLNEQKAVVLIHAVTTRLPWHLLMDAVVFGSAAIALNGVDLGRLIDDLDIFVSDESYDALKAHEFCRETEKKPGVYALRVDSVNDVEILKTFPGVTHADVTIAARTLPNTHGLRVLQGWVVNRRLTSGSRGAEWPNKPMVPTAPTSLAEPALPSGRRHIGQPLGDLVRVSGPREMSATFNHDLEETTMSTASEKTMSTESRERTRLAAAGWIGSADTKATALLTISGALLALLAAVFATSSGVRALPVTHRIAFVGFCLASIVSIAASTATLWPRTNRSALLKERGWPNPGVSPTFFGDQASLSHKEFGELHANQNETSLAGDLSEQAHIMCVIAAVKMKCLRVSIATFAFALLCLAGLVIVASTS